MQLALPSLLMAVAIGQTPRECYQTANFTVYAESADAAKQIGDAAEVYRRDLAKLWLGDNLEDWSAPCRIDVTLGERTGGVTEVTYAERKVLFHRIKVDGPLDRMLKGPLPHELTHLLFGHHFGQQVPRWVDEGGAILSESALQRAAHGKVFRQILDKRKQYPLREFFGFREYTDDVPRLYAQGHSVCGFLVAAKGHKTFLTFVRDGLDGNWDDAAKDRYGYETVEHLERAWLAWAARQSEAVAAPRKR